MLSSDSMPLACDESLSRRAPEEAFLPSSSVAASSRLLSIICAKGPRSARFTLESIARAASRCSWRHASRGTAVALGGAKPAESAAETFASNAELTRLSAASVSAERGTSSSTSESRSSSDSESARVSCTWSAVLLGAMVWCPQL